ncbi:uncharacterized protein K452DRAFT_317600 [Aplosporella prunicola CBS 121167]|uniref:PEBP-like protein n=1 Tax=Aplosporella prunicola CBS 121167 TaxID=1176127 RepID=A0A6A6BHJ2_9PEZI|nr:uncharacterized protein K452DRAFT_317600 [Aplosporella prunicola CBS 121167]KAF2143466.1 hypothetical protein K452DRAFT_317600 [Aplosporella prunicola CBS 121167]
MLPLDCLVAALALFAGAAWAQTPPNFQPSTNVNLPATFDENKTVGAPSFFPLGGVFSMNATQSQPTVYLPANTTMLGNGTLPATYILMMVDPDAPSPSNTSISDVLHWLQPGIRQSRSVETTTTEHGVALAMLSNSTAPLAPYMGPHPPSVAPHRYILMLFRQPDPSDFIPPPGFEAFFNGSQRTNFNLTSFLGAAGLGSPVAANYFLCGNETTGNGSETYNGTDAAPGVNPSATGPSSGVTPTTSPSPRVSPSSSSAASSGAGKAATLGFGALSGAVVAAVWLLGC